MAEKNGYGKGGYLNQKGGGLRECILGLGNSVLPLCIFVTEG